MQRRRRQVLAGAIGLIAIIAAAIGWAGRGSPKPTRVAQKSITAASSTAPAVSSPTEVPSATSTTSTATAAPSATPTTRPAGGPGLTGKVIAIDPGHDGANGQHTAQINRLVPAGGFTKECDTTGTQTNSGYTEATYNFDVAQRLAADLRQQGATIVLTRSSNDGWGPCVDQRAAIGNQAHADAAISIHADGGPASGRGFHVIQPALIRGFTDNIVSPSHQLALDVRASFVSTGMPYSTYAGSQALDTRSDLGGLNLSQVPKVFIECGNMRNATDALLLTSPTFRQAAADALAAALRTYLTS